MSQRSTFNEKHAPDFFSRQVSAARRFYLNLKPSRRVPLSIVSGGLEHCLANYEIHRPGFPFYSLEYVVRGQGSLRLNGRGYVLQPGIVFSYGPGISHDIVADPKAPPVKYFVDFFGGKSEEILRTSGVMLGNSAQMSPPHEIQ